MCHVGFQISLIHLLLVQLGSSRAVTYCWVFKSDARWVGKWVRWFNLSRALAELTYCKSAQSFIDGDKTQELWHEPSMDAMVTQMSY
jgi:hypothetical protein